MIVKVCGMREPDNIRAVEQTGPDWMGFIFFPHSSRHVSLRPAYLPERCKRVGVFVNEVTPAILQKAEEFDLHYIQLHGTETSEQCLNLKRAGLGVIKVFPIASMSDLKSTACYENVCDYFLFDTACTGYGGSGKSAYGVSWFHSFSAKRRTKARQSAFSERIPPSCMGRHRSQ